MVLNGNLQLGGSAPSAEEKMAEKKIMRAISKRRQKERNSQILFIIFVFIKFLNFFPLSNLLLEKSEGHFSLNRTTRATRG